MSMLRILVSLAAAAAAAMLSHLAMATNYTVGSPTGGWDTSSNLHTWASSQTFSVGDNLIFQYTPNHNVVEVTKADYDSCQNSNPIQMHSGGTTPIPLVSSGTRYFICGTSGHCSQGMKVEIDTLAASTPPPPASPPPTPTPPPPPSSPPATPTPPPVSPQATPTPPPTKTSSSPPASSPPTVTPTSQPPASGGPASSPSVPPTESPANSPPPSVFSPPPPPPISAAKVKLMSGSAMGFAFVVMMLLFL